eukprot:162514-Hanusia_phi.AAC.1
MLPYHPNPLPSCRPAPQKTVALAAAGGGDAVRQDSDIPSAIAAQTNGSDTSSHRPGGLSVRCSRPAHCTAPRTRLGP